MPNTREKLIELLINSPGLATLSGKQEEFAENADWLIANGVTINRGTEDTPVAYNLSPTEQKWIPVTERLPEKDGHYLCNYHFGEYPKMTFTRVLDYYATDIVPHFQHTLGDGSMKVTHWMPMPEPPKGE